jgi:small subunit ribosomal protein S5
MNTNKRQNKEIESEWQERVIQIKRVNKVVKGGKKISFRAVVAVGNGKGQVGVGIGKANEVIGAVQKAVTDGKKNLVDVAISNQQSIFKPITSSFGASRVLLKPSKLGSGLLAGGCVRTVLELAGIKNILAKQLGSNSQLNNARATIQGLSELNNFS